jgi:hypothetical protein
MRKRAKKCKKNANCILKKSLNVEKIKTRETLKNQVSAKNEGKINVG